MRLNPTIIFLSTLSLRRATPETGAGSPNADISIHALLAESDMGVFESEHDMCISIHALLAESDQTNGSTTIPNFNFYPRSPCGERPKLTEKLKISSKFLSTLSLRRATPTLHDIFELFTISIHALLAESDSFSRPLRATKHKFLSTLSLRRATQQSGQEQQLWQFLSTLSLRRATLAPRERSKTQKDFYPRSPCGERPCPKGEEQDTKGFLSTLSLRRATRASYCCRSFWQISIHALLAESDYTILIHIMQY